MSVAFLAALLYMAVIWGTTANTPQGDGYVQSIFTVVHYLEAPTFFEKLSNTWWTYFQNRAVFTKSVTLIHYFLLGYLDLHTLCLIGNLTLCIMVGLISCTIVQHRLPAYGMPVASLMILSFYSWTVSTWPMCTVFYFGTLMLSFGCFYFLDLPKPQVLAAAVCAWLATLTMANGFLALIIGSLIVIYNRHNLGRYSSRQYTFWFVSVVLCLLVHFSTMNVFSTDLYGAKSVQNSFINLSGRAIDFLESMGAAPFFPGSNRVGKIILGCIILSTMAVLATSRQSFKSPAIVGMSLFSTGTLFLTSLFRYSAGDNDGYQVFTAINMACVFIIASSHITATHYKVLPSLMLAAALLFNINALANNLDNMLAHRENMTKELRKFLVTGNPESRLWSDVMLHEGLEKNLYRPLQSHQTLKIPVSVETLDHCAESNTSLAGKLVTSTAPTAFAIAINATILVKKEPVKKANDNLALLLCGEKSYRLSLGSMNVIRKKSDEPLAIEVLADKRTFIPGKYRALVQNDESFFELDTPLDISGIAAYQRQDLDCSIMKDTVTFKSGQPVVRHYCNNP